MLHDKNWIIKLKISCWKPPSDKTSSEELLADFREKDLIVYCVLIQSWDHGTLNWQSGASGFLKERNVEFFQDKFLAIDKKLDED